MAAAGRTGAAAALVLGAAAVGGLAIVSRPSSLGWYAALDKPRLTPPPPVVGGAWTALEALLALAGGRFLAARPSPARSRALAGWGASLLGLAVFPWVFFRLRRPAAATGSAAAMLAATLFTTTSGRKVDGAASAMMLPLAAWLALAVPLCAELARRNRT